MHIPTLVTVTSDSCFAETKKFSGGKLSFCIPQRRHDRFVLCSRGDRIFLVVESALFDHVRDVPSDPADRQTELVGNLPVGEAAYVVAEYLDLYRRDIA